MKLKLKNIVIITLVIIELIFITWGTFRIFFGEISIFENIKTVGGMIFSAFFFTFLGAFSIALIIVFCAAVFIIFFAAFVLVTSRFTKNTEEEKIPTARTAPGKLRIVK